MLPPPQVSVCVQTDVEHGVSIVIFIAAIVTAPPQDQGYDDPFPLLSGLTVGGSPPTPTTKTSYCTTGTGQSLPHIYPTISSTQDHEHYRDTISQDNMVTIITTFFCSISLFTIHML